MNFVKCRWKSWLFALLPHFRAVVLFDHQSRQFILAMASKKHLFSSFFTLVTGTTEGYRWICGAERKQKLNSGWSNLENHLLSAHKEQYFAVKDARDDDQLPLTLQFEKSPFCETLLDFAKHYSILRNTKYISDDKTLL